MCLFTPSASKLCFRMLCLAKKFSYTEKNVCGQKKRANYCFSVIAFFLFCSFAMFAVMKSVKSLSKYSFFLSKSYII